MNVSTEQRERLYNYLKEIFRYRETLTEIYDHVLSAVEQYEGHLPYQEVVTQIIQYDFGGTQRLHELEKNFKSATQKDIYRQFWKTFLVNLCSMGTFLALIVYVVEFYTNFNLLTTPAMLIIAGLYFILITCHHFFQPFRAGYLYGNKKESVKDKILTRLFSYPTRLPWLLFYFDMSKHQIREQVQLIQVLNFVLIVTLYILLPVFILSYYMAFKKEYTLKAINN